MEHCKYLENQYLNERTADVYFIVENNERIPAHKAILAANSSLLEKHFNECIDVKTVEIPNASPSAFKEFLFAFYSKYPDKKFTIENASMLLQLAKMFDVAFCIHMYEQYLLKTVTTETLCFAYDVAKRFALVELELYCQKQINSKKSEVFKSEGFLNCDPNLLQNILENMTIIQREEVEMVWNACMNWAGVQCVNLSIDPSDMKNRRFLLGKCFAAMRYIALYDADFATHFNTEELNVTQSTAIAIKPDDSPNLVDTLVFQRFRETMLATQLCRANETVAIELRTTKEITLTGIAFSSVIGVPKGWISIRFDDNESNWIEQRINVKSKHQEPRNFSSFSENVVLKPQQIYLVHVTLSKDVVFYRSRTISDSYSAKDFDVSLKVRSGRDILSHFFFTT